MDDENKDFFDSVVMLEQECRVQGIAEGQSSIQPAILLDGYRTGWINGYYLTTQIAAFSGSLQAIQLLYQACPSEFSPKLERLLEKLESKLAQINLDNIENHLKDENVDLSQQLDEIRAIYRLLCRSVFGKFSYENIWDQLNDAPTQDLSF